MSLLYCPTASILLILSVVFGFSEACSSRSTPKIRPPNVVRPNITFRTYSCPKEPAERLCLNGGTCFTLFQNSTDFFCKCAEGYCGVTCADKYTRNGCFSSSSSASIVLMASSGTPRPPETFPCPPGPAEWLCLNGGTCFTVFENATDFACHCTEGYCGLTCGEKYTRYGCFSRYLVISASITSAGTLTVLLVVSIVIAIYYLKKSAYNDAELKTYFDRSLNFQINDRSLSLSMDNFEDLDCIDSQFKKEVENCSAEYFFYKDDNCNEKKIFINCTNIISLI